MIAQREAKPGLDAALRRAHAGDPTAVAELCHAIELVSDVVAVHYVAEALAAIGSAGGCAADQLLNEHGIAALVGVRTMLLLGYTSPTAVDAIRRSLSADRANEVRMAAWIAGEGGDRFAGVAAELVSVALSSPKPPREVFRALAAVSPGEVMPLASKHPPPATLLGVIEALGALGTAAAGSTPMLVRTACDEEQANRVRLAAVDALARIEAPAVSRALESLATDSNRWVRISCLRLMAQAATRCRTSRTPRETGRRDWWMELSGRVPVVPMRRTRVRALVCAGLQDADTDVCRNAEAALAAIDAEIDRQCQHAAESPEIVEQQPDVYWRHVRWSPPRDHARFWQDAGGGRTDQGGGASLWEFLTWLTAHQPVLLHGSNRAGLRTLRADRSGLNSLHAGGDRVGIFATTDAMLAIFYAILDTRRSLNRSSNSNRLETTRPAERRRVLATDFPSLADRPFCSGTVYVVPRDGFVLEQEWAHPGPLTVRAAFPVEPHDLPILDHVRGLDVGGGFGDCLPRSLDLRDVARFPSTFFAWT